jgi:hypothetical protein
MIDPRMERRRELRDRLAFASIGSEWNLATVAIATDAKPHEAAIAPEPSLPDIQPDAGELAMSSLVASFYEGVSFQTGRQRHDEYIRQKAMSHA